LQKYTSQAEKDRHVYLKALAAFEAGKKTGVPLSTKVACVFSYWFIVCAFFSYYIRQV